MDRRTRAFLFIIVVTLLRCSPGLAQQLPSSEARPVGIACAYNSALPGLGAIPQIPDGYFGYVQCDPSGRLILANSWPSAAATLPQSRTFTNTTTTIPAGTAVTVLPTRTSRYYLAAANNSTSTCFYSFSGTASATSGMPLPANFTFVLESSVITQQALSIYCPQAGDIRTIEGQ